MALTLPVHFEQLKLWPAGGIPHAMEESGLLITGRRLVRPWTLQATTDKLDQGEFANLSATLLEAEERNLRFDFVHPRFALPRAYTPATWPMAGDAALEAVPNLYTIDCSLLPIGLMLKKGDRLTLMQGELRCYCMLSADVTVASSVSELLPVLPRLPIGVFSAGAAVRLEGPMVRLALLPDSYDVSEQYQPRPISLELIEALA